MSNANIQDLLDSFDSIPSIMSKLNRTGDSVKSNRSATAGQDRIARQASKVMTYLSKIDNAAQRASSDRTQRDISETAALARQKLKAFYDRVGDARAAFSGYDTLRRGKVSYSDFSDTLLVANSGLTRDEAHILAARLDSKKSGSVEYTNVLQSLQELEQLHPALSTQSSNLSIGSSGGGGSTYSEIHGSKLGRQQPQKTTTQQQQQQQKLEPQPRYGRYQRSDNDNRSVATTGRIPTSTPTKGGGAYEENYSSKYLGVSSSSSVDGNPVVSVQYLSPTRPKTPQSLARNAPRYDPIRDWMKPHRRGAGEHRDGPPPYHVDPEGHLGYGDTVRRKRSSSAPPRQSNTRPASLKDHILSVSASVDAAPAQLSSSAASVPGDAGRPVSYARSTSSSRGRSAERKSLYNTLARRANPDAADSFSDDVGSVGSRKTINLPPESQFFNHYHKRFMPGISRNWNSKTMHKIFDEGFAAEEDAREYRPPPKNYRKEVEDSVVENSIAAQLSGRTNVLRHLLRQADMSGSGKVNFLEFEHALKKAGVRVPQQQLKELFQVTALDAAVPGHGGICYTAGKSLNIEDFVAKVADHASKQELSYLTEETRGTAAVELERRRVLKKVLHATNRQSDPLKVFADVDEHHLGYLKPEQIRDALTYVGAALSDREFGYLMQRIDQDQDGKISIAEFDRLVHGDVVQYERDHITGRRDAAAKNPRYTATYNSNELFHHHALPEYSKSNEGSKSARQDRRRWSKLRGVLQEHCEQVVAAFKNGDRKYWLNNDQDQGDADADDAAGAGGPAGGGAGESSSGRSARRPSSAGRARRLAEFGHIPVGLLRRELEEVGVPLGGDDGMRLDELVRRELNMRREEAEAERKERAGTPSKGPKFVSLDRFCDIIGIQMSINPSTKELEVTDPRNVTTEAGAFSGYTNHTTPTYKTTFLSSSVNHNEISGSCAKHVPQPVYEHTYEPHKFWKLEHSKGVPDIMPCPIPSFRDPLPVDKFPIVRPKGAQIDLLAYAHRRGRTPVPGTAGPVSIDNLLSQTSAYMAAQGNENQAEGIFDRSRSTLQNIMAKRRASSAPPRSQSSGTGTSSAAAAPLSPSKVSRFATKSLADFIDSRNAASDMLSLIDSRAAASPKFASYAAKTRPSQDHLSVGSAYEGADDSGSRGSGSETPRNFHYNTGFSHNNGYQGQSTLFRLNLADNAPATALGTLGGVRAAAAGGGGGGGAAGDAYSATESPARYTLRRPVPENVRDLRDVSKDGPFARFSYQK